MIARAKRSYTWPDGRQLSLGDRTVIMGILNVTADSFSDGGKWNTLDKARRHVAKMEAEGADIIDIGAESSRPGFVPISSVEEQELLLPFLEAVLAETTLPVSVDTFKAETARAALTCGAHIINDIWGLQYSAEPGLMAKAAAEFGSPVIVMHNQQGTAYEKNIILSMQDFFVASLQLADKAGLARQNVIFDPGIGFGKTAEQNLYVLHHLAELSHVNDSLYPLLLGASRKSFIGHALGLPVDERMEATGAVCVLAVAAGCGIMRVHDVQPIKRMCQMADAILEA